MKHLKLFRPIVLSCSSVILSACVQNIEGQSKKTTVDIIVAASRIYIDADNSLTGASIAIDEGEIVAVGPDDVINDSYVANKELDLGDATVFPGFIDAHAHLLGIGMRELSLNLEGTKSIADLVAKVEIAVGDSNPGDVIFGRGWIETGWPDERFPNASDLDNVSPDNPVILGRADGHAMVVNSQALKAANINAQTPDPSGGRIDRNSDNNPSGMLIDNAMALITPLIDAPTLDRKQEAYAQSNRVYAEYGWTGIHNMSVAPENLALIEQLSDDGVIGIRVYNSVDPDGLDALIEQGYRSSANNRVITRAVKLYVDGALGSRGAALSAPYSDEVTTDGLLLMSKIDALSQFEKAITADIQVNTHAIGDRGNKLILDWYEEIFSNHPDKKDRRWRIEHSQILHVEDIPRFSALGVIPSMQPSHAIGDLHFAPKRLGSTRLAGAYAWQSLIDSGSIIAGGSDAPVERGDSRIEFYAAVARKDVTGFSGPEWNSREAVSRSDALKMFTLWPAIASFQEDRLGTIEVGKRADLSVFAKDIMTIPEAEILTTSILMTMVDGQVIYQADAN